MTYKCPIFRVVLWAQAILNVLDALLLSSFMGNLSERGGTEYFETAFEDERSVPRVLTVNQKWDHVAWSRDGFQLFHRTIIVVSAVKVVATFSWNCQEKIFVCYLENGKTITGADDALLLDQLKIELQEKRRWLAHKKNVLSPRRTSCCVRSSGRCIDGVGVLRCSASRLLSKFISVGQL